MLDVVGCSVCVCNSSVLDVEAEGLGVQGHPWLHRVSSQSELCETLSLLPQISEIPEYRESAVSSLQTLLFSSLNI